MSVINQALGRLHESLDYLDLAVQEQEKRLLKAKQQDMFNVRANEQVSNRGGIDTAIVAQKLDAAIAKVEMMLQEG